MTTQNVNKGWLKDHQGSYFAPKTLVSLISDSSGTTLNNILISKAEEIEANSKNYVDEIMANMVGSESVDQKITKHNFNENAHDDLRETISTLRIDLDNLSAASGDTLEKLKEALDLIKENEGSLSELSNKLSKTDVIDNLDYNGDDIKALSVQAGATINDRITTHTNATGDSSPHITSDERTKLTTAYQHSQANHAPSIIAAGNGIDIDPDTNNDKITIKNTGIIDISISSGDSNGSIKVSTNGGTASEVTVQGLKDTAFTEAANLTAGKASALVVSSAVGGDTEPIYFNTDGKPEKCSKYAGATKVKLNGADKNSADIEIYAPTTNPTNTTTEYILKANAGGAPTWVEHVHEDKQDAIIGAASSITSNNLTANRVLISDGNGKVAISGLNSNKLEYLSDVESGIQSQIDTLANQLGGYTITYSPSPPQTGTANTIITLVPRGAK